MKIKPQKIYPIRSDVVIGNGEVKILDEFLRWRGKQVRYSNTPSISKLFKLFGASPNFAMSKVELMEKIYGNTQGRSEQFLRAVNHNIVKRISRARKFMKNNFNELSDDVDWFFYDQREECWRLYQYRYVQSSRWDV